MSPKAPNHFRCVSLSFGALHYRRVECAAQTPEPRRPRRGVALLVAFGLAILRLRLG